MQVFVYSCNECGAILLGEGMDLQNHEHFHGHAIIAKRRFEIMPNGTWKQV